MDKLNKDWLTERCVDFEYKKYMLLAYLQHVDSCYRLNKLYPPLADLIEHYRTAKLLKENKQTLSDAFPQRFQGFDAEKFRLNYNKVISDDALMREMENILDFSLPRFEEYVQEGRAIFEYMEREMVILPVGISPLDPNNGYLFLKDLRAETRVYEYTITIFEQPGSRYRAIHTTYVETYRRSITKTFNWIKEQLICKNPALPNPAVFAVESGLDIPVEETFLPIAKRLLVRQIESGKV